ncbi:MAG TPA: DUF2119 family protein [Candidatus Bathyarchaeia archaeon]|nr:DUF2119 family protein [Candidatus Bathyarchaeia archaeon]
MVFDELEDCGMKLYRSIAPEKGPTKLFVGGLHGNEGLYTAPILERLAKEDILVGEAIIVPSLVKNSKYIGVLSEEYYRSEAGMRLLQLIQEYKPSFYFELHAYETQSYSRLTDPERVKKIGVPNFIDLDDGILIGSIAPILRREFTVNDFCMTIELPKRKSESEAIKEKVLEVLRIALTKTDREELMREFRMRYPEEVKMAEELFHQYYRKRLKPF